MSTVQIVENVDNTGTLYQEVLLTTFGEEADSMLINTKFLRAYILKMIKEFVEIEDVACVKEFSTEPIMIYATDDSFNYEGVESITTDLVIVNNALLKSDIQAVLDSQPIAYPLVVEALSVNDISTESWDNYLDDLILSFSNDIVRKVIVEDGVFLLKSWSNIDAPTKDLIKEYNADHDIDFDINTFFEEPLSFISKKYWEELSFVLTINDYDIYSDDTKYLDIISERYFNNGYFDEIVIKINYFYWHDDFEKIVQWTQENLKSTLVSYRFDTIFSNTTKNRYFDDTEALKYNDILRKNTVEEEIYMFEERLPLFLNAILINPQTFGFELVGGYFGNEGFLPNIHPDSEEYDVYKDITCKTIAANPFATFNDNIVRIFNTEEFGKQYFFCMKTNE
ncbi:MAG: hypothetical protein DRH57_05920 [Candidatus Cloacimonadota bacterium]|nr:MAG: hypothetical protein DRH57_05920 [Candidatus Cloacimonadota bacterium]